MKKGAKIFASFQKFINFILGRVFESAALLSTATDTSDNNDVWNSKLLYDAGVELEIGKSYKLNFSLSGDNGVGEFFVCRSQDLNDRYDSTLVNAGGNQSVTFTAVSDKLYIGMQFGNIGKGNSVDVCITEIKPYKKPENTFAEAPKISYEAAMENGVLVIRATDCSNNNDVWDSTLLYNIASNLIPGKKYEISFELSGDHGVGEFFLCKSNDLNSRYDATFLSDGGLKTVIFTAENANAFVGMQIGNVGKGNTVTAKIISLQPYDEVTGGSVGVKTAQSCTQSVTTEGNKTVIAAKDTSDNNDVWSSKLLYFFGSILEAGKKYIAKINLAGDNGVGEFFFLKFDNMDDRYSFDNEAGDHTVTFTAEGDKLYAGMQFGNIGKGNSVDVTIQDVFEKPFEQKSAENCSEDMNRGSVTLTDTDDNGDVWNSKAVYDTGIVLEKGKTYTATVKLSGDNVGEFFFLKSDNIDDRYSFSNTSGEHTITFTAEDTALLYFGVQCGNIGKGNSVTVSNITVKEADSTQPATLCIALTPVAEQESAIEQSAVTEQETGTEQDAIAEQEPVAERESAIEQSAVTEQEPVAEQEFQNSSVVSDTEE